MTSSDPAASGSDSSERRATDRRRYNRRTSALSEAGPPYYEAFNRIATAMEAMQHSVEALVETLAGQAASGRASESRGSSGRRLPDPPPRPRAG